VASIYGPISYGPLPFLAFKLPEEDGSGGVCTAGSGAVLAATGTLRTCDPDRVILKKITLTGKPGMDAIYRGVCTGQFFGVF